MVSDLMSDGGPGYLLSAALTAVNPVCVACSQFKARTCLSFVQLQGVESWIWRLRTEAQYVIIWRVV